MLNVFFWNKNMYNLNARAAVFTPLRLYFHVLRNQSMTSCSNLEQKEEIESYIKRFAKKELLALASYKM